MKADESQSQTMFSECCSSFCLYMEISSNLLEVYVNYGIESC